MSDILYGQITHAVQAHGILNEAKGMEGSFDLYELPIEQYTGSYIVTPTDSTQTLETENTTLLGNITINPIPSNYGLITYDGTIITVS